MGLVSRLFRASSPYVAAFERGDDLPNQWGPGGTVIADPNGSLYFIPVYACVTILADAIATLPLHLYRKLSSGGKERADGHPLYPLLHDMPNPDMTTVEILEALVGHLALWGNAYAELQTENGRITAIWPLRPDRMKVERDGTIGLIYRYTMQNGEDKVFPGRSIWHIRGFSSNGVIGYSPIQVAAQALTLAQKTEAFGTKFFANDSRPGGVLQTPNKLTAEAADRLKQTWEAAHQGVANAWRVAVLEEGLSWQSVGVPPEAAQFLQTRKYQLAEIARLYRIPLHMIGELDRSTNNNIEHQAIDFVTHTLRPWLVRIEKSILRSLIPEEERSTVFAEFNIDGLLRGDFVSRNRGYAIGRQWGWYSADDVRSMENMNPLPDGAGQTYLTPMNMLPAGTDPLDPASTPASPTGNGAGGAQ